MSSADPGHAAGPQPLFAPRSAPVALVSRSALAANARVAVRAGEYATSLLEADAWGHGATFVRETLAAEGFVARDGAAGSTDPLTLFGLPGGAAGSVPVLRLYGTVLTVKPLLQGEGVSYGYTHRAAVDTRVALVAGGYAQGVVRSLGDRVEVAIAGARHPIVGRVAMDVCVVDIGDADVRRGDPVAFFGDPAAGDPSLAEWADACGLRAGELVTAVGVHAQREAVA